jgi:hypothetical protein
MKTYTKALHEVKPGTKDHNHIGILSICVHVHSYVHSVQGLIQSINIVQAGTLTLKT